MPECVQLFRRYNLRLGLLVKYRPLHIGSRLRWEHDFLGIIDYVDSSSNYFRMSRL